jgi:hypothetical protein
MKAPREVAMRSVIDWLSEFYGPKRNPYLRLSEADRHMLTARAMSFVVVVAVLLVVWRLIRNWIA